MRFNRANFFMSCKADHDRLCKLMEAGEVSVSSDIVDSVKTKGQLYSVYRYTIGDKEYSVTKRLHEFLVKHGTLKLEEA